MTAARTAGVASPAGFGLETTPEELRRLLAAASDRLVRWLEALPEAPASGSTDGRALARELRESLPEAPTSGLDDLLATVFDRAAPDSFNTAGPGFLAYIPGGGLPLAAVADLIAGVLNRYATMWTAAPGLAQIEQNVVRWFCEIVGYPEAAGGYLATGGSLATFSAVVAARRDRLPEDFLRGTLYAADQMHHCLEKAALLAGFPARNLRRIPVDDRYRLRLDALEAMIAHDRDEGFRPFLVAGSAGTTNTGAVDPLDRLADLAEREHLWFHVDGAYGGFFALTERGRDRMRGLPRADSIVLDPHKGLFLPYGTGCLLVREPETLRRSHSVVADYLPDRQTDPDHVDFALISPELSRELRGLRVWLPMKLLGADAFRRALDEKLDLASRAAQEIERLPAIELVAGPQLSAFAFRLRPAGVGDPAALDRLNRRLLDRINARQRVFLTGTRLRGDFVLRICVLSFRTHREQMDACVDDIRDSAAELLEEVRTEAPRERAGGA